MRKSNEKQIKVYLSAEQLDFIFSYQLADKIQFIKLKRIREELMAKRPDFKRANIILTLADLDALLVNIAREGNKQNNSPENQYLLDALFAKFADKYNANVER